MQAAPPGGRDKVVRGELRTSHEGLFLGVALNMPEEFACDDGQRNRIAVGQARLLPDVLGETEGFEHPGFDVFILGTEEVSEALRSCHGAFSFREGMEQGSASGGR